MGITTKLLTVYQADTYALTKAVKFFIENNTKNEIIQFYSDSQAVIKSLKKEKRQKINEDVPKGLPMNYVRTIIPLTYHGYQT